MVTCLHGRSALLVSSTSWTGLDPPGHLGCKRTWLSLRSHPCQACAHMSPGIPEALMRKGRALSWAGRQLETTCDIQFSFLVEDEDFSILLAALESRCVAAIRS